MSLASRLILLSGTGGGTPPPSVPTAINFSYGSFVYNAPAGTVLGTLTTVGGVGPWSYTVSDSRFLISGMDVIRSLTGTLTPGVPVSLDFTSTDSNAASTNTATNGQGPFSVPVVSPGAVFTTVKFKNQAGGSLAAGGCTQMFALAFNPGEVPAGQAPVFQTLAGNICPFSAAVLRTVHSDGSLDHCSFIIRTPESIAAGATMTVQVSAGGSWPAGGARTLADFAAGGLDLNWFVTGQDNLAGDWTSGLNQGVGLAAADNYHYMTGDAGDVWRVRAPFRQGGSDHGQLEGYWYAAALTDGSGNLAGVRYLCEATQPWYNAGGGAPAQSYRTFSVSKIQNSAGVVRDLMASMPGAFGFTWTSGVTLHGTSTAGFQQGLAAKLTTTGTLPAGLTAGTLYCTGNIDPLAPNNFSLGTDFANTIIGFGFTSPTNAGTGTHTVTFYPYLTAFGGLSSAETNGRWSYIQGGGSLAADNNLLTQFDASYQCETGKLPPYWIGTINPPPCVTYPYFLNTTNPLSHYTATTGERSEIGLFNSWQAGHILNQSAENEQMVRVIGLIGLHLPITMRDVTTKSIPVVNAKSYSGMPSPNTNFQWTGGGGASGLTPPSNPQCLSEGFNYIDFSHMTPFAYYAYFITGEPQFADLLNMLGNAAVYVQYPAAGTATVTSGVGAINTIGAIRNATINGTARQGMFAGGNGIRDLSWGYRALVSTFILPAGYENSFYRSYFDDLVTDTLQGQLDYISMLASGAASFVTDNGIWWESANANSQEAAWQKGYYINSNIFGYALTKKTQARDYVNYLLRWPAHVAQNWTGWMVPDYYGIVRQTNSGTSPYITSDTLFAALNWSATWTTSGLFVVSFAATTPGWVLSNGDKFVFQGVIPPGGLSENTAYYAINVSGNVCQLAAVPGGAALTITDSGNVGMYSLPAVLPAAQSGLSYNDGSGYIANIRAVVSYANAVGLTVSSNLITQMNTQLFYNTGYVAALEAEPKYAVANNYV